LAKQANYFPFLLLAAGAGGIYLWSKKTVVAAVAPIVNPGPITIQQPTQYVQAPLVQPPTYINAPPVEAVPAAPAPAAPIVQPAASVGPVNDAAHPSDQFVYYDGDWHSTTDATALEAHKAAMKAALLNNNKDMSSDDADKFLSQIDTVQQAVAIQAGLNQ
jgi:hypothetical protein